MITFACVWVSGNVPYDADYVHKLRDGVAQNYSGTYRFVCLTDRKQELRSVDAVPIKSVPGIPGWWSKIELFNPAHELQGRVVYLDLDTLVVGDLSPVVDYPSAFALVPDEGDFQGRGNLRVVKKYNSSVMVFDHGPRMHRLHELWNVNVARRLWGDQDYIGQMLPNEDVMPLKWFPRLSSFYFPSSAGGTDAMDYFSEHEARVVLSKKPKNREAAQQMTWFRELW